MPGIKDLILQNSFLFKDEVIELRRRLHQDPELSYREYMTSQFLEEYLIKYNISYRKGIAGTGIIGRIDGLIGSGRIVAVRAEMDALPVMEKNEASYKSRQDGLMHACGHDAHMAMLLGTLRVLERLKDKFGGTVLFIFQPGEEKSPGGARLIIESGELNLPKPDIILAQHILPELETGKIGYRPGRYMASCDELYITVSGKGGHAALPGLTTDQIYIASKLVASLKEEVTKKQSETNVPTVLGIGKIIGDGATNVIPDKVEIAGTLRTFDEGWRKEAQELIRHICRATAAKFGVEVSLRIEEGYPVLVNDEALTMKAVSLSRELLGEERVEIFTETRMTSDDFSFYSQMAPSLYYRVGIRKKGTEMKKLHTSEFDIDEDGLETGVGNLSWLIFNFVSGNSY